jgi:hypothetical protein
VLDNGAASAADYKGQTAPHPIAQRCSPGEGREALDSHRIPEVSY